MAHRFRARDQHRYRKLSQSGREKTKAADSRRLPAAKEWRAARILSTANGIDLVTSDHRSVVVSSETGRSAAITLLAIADSVPHAVGGSSVSSTRCRGACAKRLSVWLRCLSQAPLQQLSCDFTNPTIYAPL